MVNKYKPTPLGEIAYITKLAGYEYTKHFDYQVGGEIIALRSLNVKNGSIDLSEIHTIPKAVSDALPRSKLICEDIVLGYVGSKLGNLAKIEEDNRFHLAPNVAVIRPNEGISSDYLLQYMQSDYFQSRLWSFASSTGQPALSMTNIRKLPVLIFPLSEQQKIAKILSTWDKAISTTECLIDNSKQHKKALMQQLLTGKKRLLNESDKRFEAEWEDRKLSELFEFSTASSKSKFIEESGENYILDMGSVSRDGKLIPSKRTMISKDFLSRGQLIMPKDDIGGGQIIGRVGYIKESNKYILSDHVYCLTPKLGGSLFLSYLINSHPVNKQLRRQANGTAQLGLGKKDAEKQLVCIPVEIEEQQKIAAVLTNADQEIELLQQQLADLQQEKKALMQQLLTGKRRVKGDGAVA